MPMIMTCVEPVLTKCSNSLPNQDLSLQLLHLISNSKVLHHSNNNLTNPNNNNLTNLQDLINTLNN